MKKSKEGEDSLHNNNQTQSEFENGQLFHQQFYSKIFLIFAVFIITLALLLSQIVHQEKYRELLVKKQINPSTALIKQIQLLHNQEALLEQVINTTELTVLAEKHAQLTAGNQKLTKLAGSYQSQYLTWQKQYLDSDKLLQRLVKVRLRNQSLKQNVISTIETLLQTESGNKDNSNAINENKTLNQHYQALQFILQGFQNLNFQTTPQYFSKLRTEIEQLLTAIDQAEFELFNQALLETLEQLLTGQENVLAKWQGYLRISQQYQQFINKQIGEVQQVNAELMTSQVPDVMATALVASPFERVLHQFTAELPKSVIYSVLWWVTAGLLLLAIYFCYRLSEAIRKRMQQLVNYCQQAISANPTNIDFGSLSYEEEQLLHTFDEVKNISQREIEYKELVKLHDKVIVQLAEQSTRVNQLNEQVGSEKEQQQKVLQQQLRVQQSQYQYLQRAIEQTRSHLSAQILKPQELNLIKCFQQINQWQLINALILEERVLKLTDVNLASELNVTLLNEYPILRQGKHQLSLKVSDQIATEVKLDIQVFSQLIRCFVELVTKEQTSNRIELSLQVKDKDFAQQRVLVTANIVSKNKAKGLPLALQKLQDVGQLTPEDALSYHYDLLLKKLHGSDTEMILTELGYQCRFILPLASVGEPSRIQKNTKVNEEEGPHSDSMKDLFAGKSLKSLLLSKEKQPVKPFSSSNIEVILAVKEPQHYINLFAQLHWLSCHVHVVNHETQMLELWQSGCFNMVITEFDTLLLSQELNKHKRLEQSSAKVILNIAKQIEIQDCKQSGLPNAWQLRQITPDIPLEELCSYLSPWFGSEKVEDKAEVVDATQAKITTKQITKSTENSSAKNKKAQVALSKLTDKNQASETFNLNRYIKHQGSAELAFYMLDEYLVDNHHYFSALSDAMKKHEKNKAQVAVDELMVNAKILAATELQHMCEHWNQLLSSELKSIKPALITKLLSKTQQAINVLSQNAQQLKVNS